MSSSELGARSMNFVWIGDLGEVGQIQGPEHWDSFYTLGLKQNL